MSVYFFSYFEITNQCYYFHLYNLIIYVVLLLGMCLGEDEPRMRQVGEEISHDIFIFILVLFKDFNYLCPRLCTHFY